jgi:hypothetical protein
MLRTTFAGFTQPQKHTHARTHAHAHTHTKQTTNDKRQTTNNKQQTIKCHKKKTRHIHTTIKSTPIQLKESQIAKYCRIQDGCGGAQRKKTHPEDGPLSKPPTAAKSEWWMQSIPKPSRRAAHVCCQLTPSVPRSHSRVATFAIASHTLCTLRSTNRYHTTSQCTQQQKRQKRTRKRKIALPVGAVL